MPSSGIWLDSRLSDLSIESKNVQNRLRTRSYGHPKLALPSSFPRRGQFGQRMSDWPEEVGSAIFEN